MNAGNLYTLDNSVLNVPFKVKYTDAIITDPEMLAYKNYEL